MYNWKIERETKAKRKKREREIKLGTFQNLMNNIALPRNVHQ